MSDDTFASIASKPQSGGSPDEQSPPPPRRKGCGCWTVSLATIAGAVVFVLGVYVVWRWSNARALERMIAIAREKGEPTTWEELAATQPASPQIERTTQLWRKAMDEADLPYAREHVIDVAIAGYADHQNPESVEAMRLYHDDGVMAPRVLAASKAYLAKLGDAVELSHAARKSGALARHALEFEVGEEAYSERVQRSRHLANVLSLDMEIRRAERETEGIEEDLLSLVALAESDAKAPDQIAQPVRFAIVGVARHQLLSSLERDELSDEALVELQRAWEAIDVIPAFKALTLRLQVEALRELPSFDYPHLQYRRPPCPEEDAYQATSMLRAILDKADDFEDVHAAIAEREADWGRVEHQPFAQSRFEGWRGCLGSVGYYATMVRERQTEVDAVVAALACERFRRDRGDWPERLDELVPDYLTQVPPDRWDGSSLKYAKGKDEIRVYSLGANATDDGGEVLGDDLAMPADHGVKLARPPRRTSN